mmetsp:Transcript_3238/g.6968  ORF Transcript_3238/g.6968 Transcript_3238/m.6968 type:complete len:247 (-) Transcript_3238:446-1186(-)
MQRILWLVGSDRRIHDVKIHNRGPDRCCPGPEKTGDAPIRLPQQDRKKGNPNECPKSRRDAGQKYAVLVLGCVVWWIVMRTKNHNDARPLYTLKEFHVKACRSGRIGTLGEGKTEKRHCEKNRVQRGSSSGTHEISHLPVQKLPAGNTEHRRRCRARRECRFLVFFRKKVLANGGNQEYGNCGCSRSERIARKNSHVEAVPGAGRGVRGVVFFLVEIKGFVIHLFVHESKKPTRQALRTNRIGCHC